MDDTTDRLHVTTSYVNGPDHLQYATTDRGARSPMSATAEKDEEQRIEDDLAMNKVERMASVVAAERANEIGHGLGRNQSTMAQTRSRNEGDPADDFDIDTTPIHEKNKIYKPPANPTTKLAKIFKSVHSKCYPLLNRCCRNSLHTLEFRSKIRRLSKRFSYIEPSSNVSRNVRQWNKGSGEDHLSRE